MHNIANIWIWLGFTAFVVIALSIDTFYLDKKRGAQVPMRVALYWSLTWISCALIFNGLLWIYLYYNFNPQVAHQVSLDFFTGYLIEKSLSIDNLFAFFLIFQQLKIPVANQRHVFSYGIWSAIVMRLVLILFGSWLIADFHWILYLFGAFLMLTGIKMFFVSHKDSDLHDSWIFKWLQRHVRITNELSGNKFLIIKNKLVYATPLLIALIFIEISDVIFAFDSIPAIFAITTDPFIVWTSNIFAILGLRALYFLLAGLIDRFSLLKYGIALILVFVGAKMLIEPWFNVPVEISLMVIALILISFSFLSMLLRKINQRKYNK